MSRMRARARRRFLFREWESAVMAEWWRKQGLCTQLTSAAHIYQLRDVSHQEDLIAQCVFCSLLCWNKLYFIFRRRWLHFYPMRVVCVFGVHRSSLYSFAIHTFSFLSFAVLARLSFNVRTARNNPSNTQANVLLPMWQLFHTQQHQWMRCTLHTLKETIAACFSFLFAFKRPMSLWA